MSLLLMNAAWIASSVAGALASPSDDGGRVPLSHKSYRTWGIELPAEQFRPIADGFAVPNASGDRFAVLADGAGISVDTDGDGTPDTTIAGKEVDGVRTAYATLTGISPAGNPIKYSARLIDQGQGWQYAPGSAAVGKIGDTRVRVIDQNNNGRYDDYGADAMVVGRGSFASFLSRVISIDDTLYEIEVAPDGTSLDYQPFAGKSGTLDVVSGCDSNAKVLAAVLRTPDGQVSFDLAASATPTRVPVGNYVMSYGRLGLGTGFVEVLPGKSNWIRVADGETTRFEWGGPVKAEFQYARQGDQVAFSPEHVWYYGAAGEQYTSFTPFGASPQFIIRDAETDAEIETAIFGGC